jgi:hypothetical protein
MADRDLIQREWIHELAPEQARVRCRYKRHARRILAYTVQLEIYNQGIWQPVVRFDSQIAEANLAEKKAARDGLKMSLKLLQAPPRAEEVKVQILAVDQAKLTDLLTNISNLHADKFADKALASGARGVGIRDSPTPLGRVIETASVQEPFGGDDMAGRYANIIGQFAQQAFPKLASAPSRLFPPQGNDHCFELGGNLVGVAVRSSRPVG